jgi:hypothetical protein
MFLSLAPGPAGRKGSLRANTFRKPWNGREPLPFGVQLKMMRNVALGVASENIKSDLI